MLPLVVLVASAGLVLAQLTPTAPGPGDSFVAGGACTIDWKPDQSDQWTNVTIYLMSGSNDNMTRVSTVSSGLDGTDTSLSPYNWTCPSVHPYSAIYFYQVSLPQLIFTNGDGEQASAWTTRFTIASPDGDSEPPEHDRQPNGDAIPWGTGDVISEGRTSEAIDADDVKADANKPSHRESDNGTPTNDPPSSARTDVHSKSPSSATLGAAGSSLYSTADPQHARPTHSPRPNSSGEAAEDIPTASLPSKKAHASSAGSASPTAGMSCSGMGPGVPQVGGMKLASSAPLQCDPQRLKVALLSLLFVLALL